MQTQIHKDTTGLRVLWDERKQCYCFEDSSGQLLPFTITMQKGDPAHDGYTGPTIEALLAIARHRLQCYNQGEYVCDENNKAIYCADMALWNLERRHRRLLADIACAT